MPNSIFSHGDAGLDKLRCGFIGAEDRHLGGTTGRVRESCSCDHYGIIQGCCLSDDIRFDPASLPIHQECFEDIARLNDVAEAAEHHDKKARQCPFSRASLGLLSSFNSGHKRLSGAKRAQVSNGYISIGARKGSTAESEKLSTEETIRLAGEMLLQSYSQTLGGFSSFTHPYHLPFYGLSEQEIKNAQVVQFLLAAAEKISQQKFERAGRFLDQCDYYSNESGNPVERVVYYFSEALRERIDRETGRVSGKGLAIDMEEALMTNLSAMASHEETPFSKINQFAGIQAIVENVTESKKIHIIDLGIRFGIQWTVLMEALATTRQESKLELLKITAVGTICKNIVEKTCKRLMRFAESMKLPFRYRIVMVQDFLHLEEEDLQVERDETVAVYSEYVLRSLLGIPDRLEHVMKVITTIAPAVMVIVETDANHNSLVFANRFIEALSFFGAYFDCLGECLSEDEKNRKIMEGVMFREGIRNMVATEGDERKIRNVRLEVWRAFMERFGPVEADFSMSSLYQANLLLRGRSKWKHCTLQRNGNGLVICWKGVPMHCMSVWKFAPS